MHKNKMRLNVDELTVESFVPSSDANGRGTVQGAQHLTMGCPSLPPDCGTFPSPCTDTQTPSYCVSPETCDWTQCVNLSCVMNCTADTCPSAGTTDPLYTMVADTCSFRLCPPDTE